VNHQNCASSIKTKTAAHPTLNRIENPNTHRNARIMINALFLGQNTAGVKRIHSDGLFGKNPFHQIGIGVVVEQIIWIISNVINPKIIEVLNGQT
jgi:hypothetical protein